MMNDRSTYKSYEPYLSKWLPVLVFLIGLWYFCFRILGSGLEFIPGDMGDSRFINFLLEHGYQWSAGNVDSFWQAGFMYPYQDSLAFSDNMLGTMPFYGFWRMFGVSQETSYQLWWMIICALNYWSAYYVMKRWFKRWDLAIIAAWIFAFTIFNLGQLNYMQMMIRFMVPIVIYSGVRLVDTSSWKYFAVFALGIVYQFYGVIYTGFFLMYFSVFLIVLYAIFQKKYWFFVPLFTKKQLLFTASTVIVSVLLLAWLMLPYYEMSQLMGFRSYDEVKWYVPVIMSYFYAHESAFAWKVLAENCRPDVAIWWIQYTFPGMIPLLVLFTAPFMWFYWKIRSVQISSLTWALSIATFVFFIFFIRSYDAQTMYKFMFKLPGMSSMRVLNRYMHVEIFFIVALLISLLSRLPKKWSAVLLLLVIFDNSFSTDGLIRTSKDEITKRRKVAIATVKNRIKPEHEAYAILDDEEAFFATQIDGMVASNYVDLPTVNGYSSGCPIGYGHFFQGTNEEGLRIWLETNQLDSSKVLIIKR
ncbi:MAG: hypothetical protein P8P74_00055 [Crocinitomicaceae bacterium]|nr:hypothetical protein [Crocinitomicaceae bacterium]